MVAGDKIHPLWQSYEMLPLLSLLTAFMMGFGIVFLRTMVSSIGLYSEIPDERPLIQKLTNAGKIVVITFLVFRFGELIVRDKLEYVFAFDFYSLLFWLESSFLLTAATLLSIPSIKYDDRVALISGVCILAGAGMWRLCLSVVANNPGDGYAYFPSTLEVLLSIGLVSIEISFYMVLIRLLPVLPILKNKQLKSKQRNSPQHNNDNTTQRGNT